MSTDVVRLSPFDAYARWADTYDQTPNPLLWLEERIVEPLLPPLDGMLAIDVGCGTGRWLGVLTRRGAARCVGLDLSPAMLGRAGQKPSLRGRLVQTDCTSLPLGDAAAGFAICSFGLGYMSLEAAARELARVVRDCGHVVLTDLHPSARARGWKRRFRHDGVVIEVSAFHYPLGRILREFAAAGFETETLVEPGFGESERPAFERCGKGQLFRESAGQAAIFVCRFRRRSGRV